MNFWSTFNIASIRKWVEMQIAHPICWNLIIHAICYVHSKFLPIHRTLRDAHIWLAYIWCAWILYNEGNKGNTISFLAKSVLLFLRRFGWRRPVDSVGFVQCFFDGLSVRAWVLGLPLPRNSLEGLSILIRESMKIGYILFNMLAASV